MKKKKMRTQSNIMAIVERRSWCESHNNSCCICGQGISPNKAREK